MLSHYVHITNCTKFFVLGLYAVACLFVLLAKAKLPNQAKNEYYGLV